MNEVKKRSGEVNLLEAHKPGNKQSVGPLLYFLTLATYLVQDTR